jgi:hypothetical protein
MITDSNHACFAKMATCGFQGSIVQPRIWLILKSLFGNRSQRHNDRQQGGLGITSSKVFSDKRRSDPTTISKA